MQEYISTIKSDMPEAQSRAIDTFISQSERDGYSVERPEESDGGKLFVQPANPTNPTQYNTAIAAAIADMYSLYAGLDAVSSRLNNLDSLNQAALNKAESEVARLEGALAYVDALVPTSVAYTHTLRQDFTTDGGDPASLPREFARLSVDPENPSLVRPIALNISKLRSPDSDSACKVSIEEMLGTSSEDRHPLTEAVYGRRDSFWREVVYSNTPIAAVKDNIPWLKNTGYSGGAAVKLRFDFEALTPVSEICLKPLADYPIEVLGVSWSTDSLGEKATGGTVDVDGTFSSWPSSRWIPTSVGTVTCTSVPESQDGSNCLKVDFDGKSTSRYIIKQRVNGLKAGAVYSLSFSAKSSTGTGFVVAQVTSNGGKAVLFRHTPELTTKWKRYTYLISMPTSISDIPELEIQFYDKDVLHFDNLQINADAMSLIPETIHDGSGTVTIPLTQNYGKPVMCRTLWLTLVQKNYTLRHYSIPRSQVDASDIWTLALGGSKSEWTSLSSPWRGKGDLLPPGVVASSPLAAAASRLGGKIKSMLAGLMRLSTNTNDELVQVTKYEYVVGAWEIDLRYKDYAPTGYWLSKPLNLRGEVRQLTFVPTTGPLESEKIKYYLLPREDSPVDIDNAYCLNDNWSVYFRSTTEAGKLTSGVDVNSNNVISLTPREPRKSGIRSKIEGGHETFTGTDRKKKIQLASHPYFDADRAWGIHTTVTSGESNKNNRYDPNSLVQTYVVDADRTIRTCSGYRPVGVTLHFPNGQVVPPDIIGRSPYTKYVVRRDQKLTEVTDDTILSQLQTNTTASGVMMTEQTARRVRVFKTSKPICYIPGLGAKIAIYVHDTKDAGQDILLDPSKYTIRWDQQAGNLTPGSGQQSRATNYADTIEILVDSIYDNPQYEFTAYYRTEVTAAPVMNDGINTGDFDYKYVDSDGNEPRSHITELSLQSYPVTRNVTDYLTGEAPILKPAVLERTRADYYPVYEYYIDENGNIIFANDLFEYGDNPAKIEVEYLTLDINPRVLIAYEAPEVGTSTCSTPVLSDYTILLNARN